MNSYNWGYKFLGQLDQKTYSQHLIKLMKKVVYCLEDDTNKIKVKKYALEMFIALFNDVAPTFQDSFSENGQFKSKNLIESFNNI